MDEFIFKAKEVPAVTSVLFFDDSADNRFHDQSFSTKTAPSTLVQEHWEGPGLPDGDKLPVVTEPVKAGANALKLQWKSAEGGSWMAMVCLLYTSVSTNNCCYEHEDEILISYLFFTVSYTHLDVYKRQE